MEQNAREGPQRNGEAELHDVDGLDDEVQPAARFRRENRYDLRLLMGGLLQIREPRRIPAA
ncbi:hypothetical protein D3C84_1040660 [compost metagenome]